MSPSATGTVSPSGERLCDGSGKLPEVCLTRVPHTHCVCGMPMQRGRRHCSYCLYERVWTRARLDREISDGVMASHVMDSGGWDTGHQRRYKKGPT